MIMLRSVIATALLFATALVGPALGAEAGKISVEFNDLQQAEGGCRAVFVLNNGLDKPLDGVTLRVVAFDGKGHAKLFLSLEVGALAVGKTRIVRFDLGKEMACADVGRIVLDDVTNCEGADFDPPKCLAAIALASRAGVPFDF
jgi:hypothetical protein